MEQKIKEIAFGRLISKVYTALNPTFVFDIYKCKVCGNIVLRPSGEACDNICGCSAELQGLYERVGQYEPYSLQLDLDNHVRNFLGTLALNEKGKVVVKGS